ncbi:hypothetical protein Tco_0531496 [Tanacetum coccineum]
MKTVLVCWHTTRIPVGRKWKEITMDYLLVITFSIGRVPHKPKAITQVLKASPNELYTKNVYIHASPESIGGLEDIKRWNLSSRYEYLHKLSGSMIAYTLRVVLTPCEVLIQVLHELKSKEVFTEGNVVVSCSKKFNFDDKLHMIEGTIRDC